MHVVSYLCSELPLSAVTTTILAVYIEAQTMRGTRGAEGQRRIGVGVEVEVENDRRDGIQDVGALTCCYCQGVVQGRGAFILVERHISKLLDATTVA
jgi:hypothetical protein